MPRRPLQALRIFSPLLLIAATAGIGGCNLVTGADDIRLSDAPLSASASTSTSSNAVVASSSTTGVGGGGGASSTAVGVGGGTPGPQPTPVGAEGVRVKRIVINQGVSRTLMDQGAPMQTDVPVLASRGALLRVFYETDGSYDGQPVTARLTFDDGAFEIETVVTLSGSSSESNLQSTINFELDEKAISLGGNYRVDIEQMVTSEDPGEGNAEARYPMDLSAMQPHDAKRGAKMKVVVVPIKYNGDGSGRLPDTSNAQMKKLSERLYAMYPTREVVLEVRQAINFNASIGANGANWSNLLNKVADVRMSDNPDFDTFYYGMFNPRNSFGAYCGGGCVAGLGFLGEINTPYTRSAIGLGFSEEQSILTAVHEIGHSHGREHAPCGNVSNADPKYPYAGGKIGVYGYDLTTGQHFPPQNFVDVMSYCNSKWTSDYNFRKNYQTATMLGSAQVVVPPALMNRTYDRIAIDGEGGATLLKPITLRQPPMAEPVQVSSRSANGTTPMTGQLVRYDHLPGGVLFVPQAAASTNLAQATATLDIVVDGHPASVKVTRRSP